MRRYDIISGILLILSTIDFALPAPLSVQEKRQERVDVVHIPKDVITVLGKHWDEELEKLGEEYLKTGGKPVDSSDSTFSWSSAPPGPDHGSTNVVQLPTPNPASSTANPDPLMELSSYSSSTSPRQGLWARGNYFGMLNELWSYIRDGLRSHYGSDNELTWAHPHPSADPDFDWNSWMNAEDPPPRPPPLEEVGQASGYAPSPPEHEPEHEVVTNSPSPSLGSPKNPEDGVVPMPPPSLDPELHLDPQPLSADSQPVDLQAAIYAAKGKAKVLRRVSSTAGGCWECGPEGVATG